MLKLLHFMDYASMLTLVNWWQTSQQDLGVAFVVGYPSKLNQELSQLINKKTKSFRQKINTWSHYQSRDLIVCVAYRIYIWSKYLSGKNKNK